MQLLATWSPTKAEWDDNKKSFCKQYFYLLIFGKLLFLHHPEKNLFQKICENNNAPSLKW